MRIVFKKYVVLLVLTAMAALSPTACTHPGPAGKDMRGAGGQEEPAEHRIIIAVSIVPQDTFVKAVAGELVDTVVLVPPGHSPENYAPSLRQLTQLSKAPLYFSIGVPAEEAAILPKLPGINQDLRIVDLAAETAKIYAEREFSPGQRDPHIWLSPQRVGVMVDVIARELGRIDPSHQDTYLQNAAAYRQELEELDRKIKASLEGLSQKSFLIYHPSFGYFADDYGLTMIAVEKEGKETTIADLKQIITLARELQIKTVFYQAETDSEQLRTVAEEIGAKTQPVAPLAPDYINNLEKFTQTIVGM